MSEIVGRRIRRIDMPAPELLSITLGSSGGGAVFVYRLRGDHRGAGLVDERPRGRAADGFTQKLRRTIGGAIVTAAEQGDGRCVHLRLRRSDGERTLLLDTSGRGRVLVLDAGRSVVAALPSSAGAVGTVLPEVDLEVRGALDEGELRRRGPGLVDAIEDEAFARNKRTLTKALSRARRRLTRRLDKIAADEARATGVDALRAEGSAILAHLHLYVAGAATLDVVDFASDPPTRKHVEIDPRLGPKGQAEALFHRARRLSRGAALAAERLRATRDELAQLDELASAAADAEDEETLRAVSTRAVRAGIRGAQDEPKSSGRKSEARLPYRRFAGSLDHAILVGRGAKDNDALTLRHAKPSDLWLHARGHRGAHVIVPLGRGQSCPGEVLLDAATLAAHFSAAAGEELVEVQHTERRHVRKPKGAAPGAVFVDRERVLLLRFEDARLRRLLANER